MSRIIVTDQDGRQTEISATYRSNRHKEDFVLLFPVWLQYAAGNVDSKDALKVLLVLLIESPYRGGLAPTAAEIRSYTRQSPSQVSNGLNVLHKADVVRRKARGVWVLSPAVAWKGSADSRRRAIQAFDSLEQFKEREEENGNRENFTLF